MFGTRAYLAGVLALAILAAPAPATETENLGLRVLPAPGKVAIDGKVGDWDLSGGLFACGDVETLRDAYSVWFHAMYDNTYVYILARWNDPEPMNNPGSVKGSMGFQGDCLQVRFITAYEEKDRERVTHWTCWRDRDGLDVMDMEAGRDFKEQKLRDARQQGARQAFAAYESGKGYVQEMAIPWTLLTRDGQPLGPGRQMRMTVEPNFSAGAGGRITLKDIFLAGVVPDRVFTFRAYKNWGIATLEPAAGPAGDSRRPRPVRLADGREFPVAMEASVPSAPPGGLPVVDWAGLIVRKEAPGFKPIRFSMPADGYLSLNIYDKDGRVVRQLLGAAPYPKGEQEVTWDGLSTPFWRTPGTPVAPGEYTWRGLAHPGIGLRLRGWAGSAGSAPWNAGPTTGWGGDHGAPAACATDGRRVYLGWSGAEAGKALVACDLAGQVQWRHIKGGIGNARLLAADGGIVYVFAEGKDKGILYRLEAGTGQYSNWEGSPVADLEIPPPAGLDALNGKLYLSYANENRIAVLDGKTGKELKSLAVAAPGPVKAAGDGRLLVVSEGKAVVSVPLDGGEARPLITGLTNATALAVDKDGRVYVGVRDPDQQVKVFSADGGAPAGRGGPAGEIGRKGGRPTRGPWTPDGLRNIAGLTVDAQGQLWVAEATITPKRISVWDAATGRFVREFFGPTHYGASGGAIHPADPNVMIGEGCEWRLDPKTGRDTCVGVFDGQVHSFARFARGSNGKEYVAALSSNEYRNGVYELRLFERLSPGQYALRSVVRANIRERTTKLWADRNGDAAEQPDEVVNHPAGLVFWGYTAWSLYVAEDLTVYAHETRLVEEPAPAGKAGARPRQVTQDRKLRLPVAQFTACGAPVYDPAKAQDVPAAGLPSPDGRMLVAVTALGKDELWVEGWDLAGGGRRWLYPSPFHGVHGSHRAPPTEPGLMRGVYGPIGTAALPKPLGTIWALNSNVGEWHLLTQDGFYLTRLFEGDPLKMKYPDAAVPGAVMDAAPPGSGGEDFGGSLTQGKDGKVYVQTGKIAFWNLEVVGLENVKALAGGKVTITQDDAKQAAAIREQLLQARVGAGTVTARKMTPPMTGNLAADFKGAESISYQKTDDAAVKSAVAWDDQNLYLAWDVKDPTPWVNGADAPEFLYARGDTVDFQLATDPSADPKRREAVRGDLRLSIGPFKGKPAAVLYRKVADEKHPKAFSSGVVKAYLMESVQVVQDAKVVVKMRPGGYTVEAAVPLKALGLAPKAGLKLSGDFGVTHGDPAGGDTLLRTYWNNQKTGIVNDEVFELQMEPTNWGQIIFQE